MSMGVTGVFRFANISEFGMGDEMAWEHELSGDAERKRMRISDRKAIIQQ